MNFMSLEKKNREPLLPGVPMIRSAFDPSGCELQRETWKKKKARINIYIYICTYIYIYIARTVRREFSEPTPFLTFFYL